MVDAFTILSLSYPEIASTIVFVVASWVSFQFSQRTRSRGFHLIFLGIFAKLVLDSVSNLIYIVVWIPMLFGPSSIVERQGLLASISLSIFAISMVSLVAMLSLILYGALEITRERQFAVTAPQGLT